MGLYLAVEAIDETFLETHFDDATGDLYKPEGQDGTGADLVYDGDDISSYTGLNLKTNEDTSDGKKIIAFDEGARGWRESGGICWMWNRR